uniref:Uncharacterized protein n=1 Tax=Arundo donax TaxID=35708 RepID=A0A0A9EB06_ARUDO
MRTMRHFRSPRRRSLGPRRARRGAYDTRSRRKPCGGRTNQCTRRSRGGAAWTGSRRS